MRSLPLLIFFLSACSPEASDTYADVRQQLTEHTATIELVTNNGQARLLLAPELQGRVITTTHGGERGVANGWFAADRLVAGQPLPAGIGGEDRLWIAPLGSQFSFYYGQERPLREDNWAVPTTMDGEAYTVTDRDNYSVSLTKEMRLTNFVGTHFYLQAERTVRLLDTEESGRLLGLTVPTGLDFVAFTSENSLTNLGADSLTVDNGLVGIWSAGMFAGGDRAEIILPLRKRASLDDLFQYFGPLGSDRLRLEDSTVYFRADGRYRSKIGIPPELAPAVYGAYDPDRQRLTIVQYQTTTATCYGNSTVSIQEEPC
ncbi:MAG: DUF6786 family protein, partial [Bacteroidota bacterium]